MTPVTPVLLVLNAGSSTLKFALYSAEQVPSANNLIASGLVDGLATDHAQLVVRVSDTAQRLLPSASQAVTTIKIGDSSQAGALAAVLAWVQSVAGLRIVAAAHRVVHGGTIYTGAVRVDAAVLAQLQQFNVLAPLHQPHNLAAIHSLAAAMPGLPQFASFDTAFHSGQDAITTRYALPQSVADLGVRRYGFHGLSYAYIASRLADAALLGPSAAQARVVVAHLGSGASLCAMHGGKSVATTMGMSALDGLVMSQRCGQLDPGVMLYLLQQGYDADSLQRLLYYESGLAGLAGDHGDMRLLLERRDAGDAQADMALRVYTHSIARALGSMAAALQGVDALVFTAGIGEHAAAIRAQVGQDSAWLGVALDLEANANHASSIHSADSRVRVFVIATDEALMIAQEAWNLLHHAASE